MCQIVRRKAEKEAESLEREMRKIEVRYNRAHIKAWKEATKAATAQARKKYQPIKASLVVELKLFFL